MALRKTRAELEQEVELLNQWWREAEVRILSLAQDLEVARCVLKQHDLYDEYLTHFAAKRGLEHL